jgi:hypothetical protein
VVTDVIVLPAATVLPVMEQLATTIVVPVVTTQPVAISPVVRAVPILKHRPNYLSAPRPSD